MSEKEKCQKLLAKLSDVDQYLKTCADQKLIAQRSYFSIHQQIEDVKKHADSILEEKRVLRIGIVGQVKAGKSSFLNSLVFEGKDILPKAATPMTAALTKISYDTAPRAEVHFYTPEEWENGMEKLAGEYEDLCQAIYEEKLNRQKGQNKFSKAIADIPGQRDKFLKECAQRQAKEENPQAFAAYETIQMSHKNDKQIRDLPECKTIPPEDLQKDLNAYVGAKGIYTPFVKYLELVLANPLLEGLEIVDTPGLGDPIQSRSAKTREFLANCDLVFLLSTASQFLNQDDIELLERVLPSKSILHAVLVATKFDGALLDNKAREPIPLKSAVRETARILEKHAKDSLSAALRAHPGNKAVQRIYDSLPPEFSSAMLYQAAQKLKQGNPLSEEEELILTNLEKRFLGMDRKPALLLGLSNMERLRKIEFQKCREKREEILEERRREFVNQQRKSFLSQLDDLSIETEHTLQNLQHENTQSLQRKLEEGRAVLYSMHRKIQEIFKGNGLDVQTSIIRIKDDINRLGEKEKYNELPIEEYPETYHHTKTHWFRKDEHWDETVYTKRAEVGEVIQHVNSFLNDAERLIGEELLKTLDRDAIAQHLKQVVLDSMEKAQVKDFSEDDIIIPVDNIMREIVLPPFRIVERDTYLDKIDHAFYRSYVEGNEIHNLKKMQTQILGEMERDITDSLEKLAEKSRDMLEEKGSTFIEETQKQVVEENKRTGELMQLKEKNIGELKKILERISAYQSMLQQDFKESEE